MKINFTKEEYRILLDMITLSDWMMHCHDLDNKNNKYKTLTKKIFSYFKEMDSEDRIEYDSKLKDYYPLRAYDEELHEKFIDSYDDESFWDELIDRLASRDVVKKIGFNALEKMEGIDRVMTLENSREIYENEFEESGLDNLLLVKKSDQH